MVTTIHKEGSSDSQYELHRPLVSKPSRLTRVTVCDPMYRCWVCGQDIRPLIILPLIIAPPLFIEVSVPSQESEWSCMCVLLYRFYLFLRFLYWILELYRQCGIFVYHFIRERVLHKQFIFSAGNEFSAVQDNLHMLNLEHFQFLLFDIPNA